jgi:phosphoserine phosphatase RsbU/P
LHQRRELLSMSFDPSEEQGVRPESSIASLEVRSVVCVPLVRVRTTDAQETSILTPAGETVGVLYMDSRGAPADLSHGNRELLQTLALEASTVLENARLLEQQRAKQRLEEELDIAREIQAGLLPPDLPESGWFRAAGSSLPSAQVGGDFFDIRRLHNDAWLTMVADVSGKGVSSALLASLLQGAFLLASDDPAQIDAALKRVNHHLLERTRGEKYATVFYATVSHEGRLQWANAGHCVPLLLHTDGQMRPLETTGFPLGMIETAEYQVESIPLEPADKVVVYSDGVTEAENREGQFFGKDRLRRVLRENARDDCRTLHRKILDAVAAFTLGAVQADDVTLVVFEFQPEVRA